ncbi:MAG: DNA polymerase Y family protein [Polyangiaceae bacterium]|nr:DNA polymerase Y family protein [Polyangiaceae bacterium]
MRRIAAVALPHLVTELAAESLAVARSVREPGVRPELPPFAVVLVEREGRAGDAGDPVPSSSLLDAVSPSAQRFGVRPGQSIAEACVLSSRLAVVPLSRETLGAALGRVAEAALAFGATVSLEPPDTVWVDVTGAAHLFGGEAALGAELASRVRALGHVVRVAVAEGPRLAQALARWGSSGSTRDERSVIAVLGPRTRAAMASLPISALPAASEHVAWFARLGVLTLGQLAELPRASAAARLGTEADRALDLAQGRDDSPLVAYRPPSLLVEHSEWDEPAEGLSPLLFVLSGLVSRVSARLAGRGEAAQKLVVVLEHDRTIARHRGAPLEKSLVFDLASPLWRAEEMKRVIVSRLERTRLEAPSVGLRLEVPAIIRALGRQLDLSRVSGGVTGQKGLESLPVVLAELGADIGRERVGVLALVDAHRPEKQHELRPALPEPGSALAAKRRSKKRARPEPEMVRSVRSLEAAKQGAPTRLLPAPVPLDAALRVGATLRVDHRLYTIERIGFVERLEAVEWWTGAPVARDYLRLWLGSQGGGLDAWVYVDRQSGKRFLQAVGD